jgi:hypothetical protein
MSMAESSPGDKKFDAAMRAASELSVKARSLMEQIQPYAHEVDPFAAIVDAHHKAQQYEEDQERRIFLGPK